MANDKIIHMNLKKNKKKLNECHLIAVREQLNISLHTKELTIALSHQLIKQCAKNNHVHIVKIQFCHSSNLLNYILCLFLSIPSA